MTQLQASHLHSDFPQRVHHCVLHNHFCWQHFTRPGKVMLSAELHQLSSNKFITSLHSVFFSWMWTTMLTYQLYTVFMYGSLGITAEWHMHLICWPIPIISTLLPLSTNYIGRDDDSNLGWCYIGGNEEMVRSLKYHSPSTNSRYYCRQMFGLLLAGIWCCFYAYRQ